MVRDRVGAGCGWGARDPLRTRSDALAERWQALAAFRAGRCDGLVAVGGGSAIDCGKGVALLLATGGAFEPYVIDYGAKGMARAPMPAPGLIHIAVPTTAGSASDVMPTAAIRDAKAGRKMLSPKKRSVF